MFGTISSSAYQRSIADNGYKPGTEVTAQNTKMPSAEQTTECFRRCSNDFCRNLHKTWKTMAAAGKAWEEMIIMECDICSSERKRRCRVMAPQDKRVHQELFLSAPYIQQNNDPKYHAMFLRANETAKHGFDKPQHILWVDAIDEVHNPKEIAKNPEQLDRKKERFLQFHDPKTAGIPGMFPFFQGMKARVTDQISSGRDDHQRDVIILKHSSCTVYDWTLPDHDRITDPNKYYRLLSRTCHT